MTTEPPLVKVYSKQRLLLAGARVAEEAVGGPENAYAYRYTGLHLLQRNDDRYFLLTVDRTPDSARLVVLKDGEAIRTELGRLQVRRPVRTVTRHRGQDRPLGGGKWSRRVMTTVRRWRL